MAVCSPAASCSPASPPSSPTCSIRPQALHCTALHSVPRIAYKEDLHGKERSNQLKQAKASVGLEEDVVHNNFNREMLFYRKAQAAVLEGLPRLAGLGVGTKRPEDYFAQMAKSDQHMNKIRAKLLSKEQGQEGAEKIKKLRELRKYGKKVQVEVQQKRLKEKKGHNGRDEEDPEGSGRQYGLP